MMAKPMKRLDVVRALARAGCAPRGTSKRGGHEVWQCSCGDKHWGAVPRAREISPGVVADLIKRFECLEKGWLQ